MQARKRNLSKSQPIRKVLLSQQTGLLVVIVALGAILTMCASKVIGGQRINTFFNPTTLLQTATDASLFAIMAVGATMVIISGGIDLSVGSVYALAGVTMAMVLQSIPHASPLIAVLVGLGVSVGVGLLSGVINGALIVGLKVHPFIITLGAMWILRGIAFVTSQAQSIRVPDALTATVKAPLGLGGALTPVPMFTMLIITILGSIFLNSMVVGRHIFALGGNPEASRYSGLRLGKITIAVFAVAGLTAGIAAFVGTSYYGAASCADATGYELYVIASTVVGGASLQGGKGSAIGATLGALLIMLIRQAITTLELNQNYEWIIIGCAIIIAVVIDQTSSRLAARRLACQASEARAGEYRTAASK